MLHIGLSNVQKDVAIHASIYQITMLKKLGTKELQNRRSSGVRIADITTAKMKSVVQGAFIRLLVIGSAPMGKGKNKYCLQT